MRTVRLCSADSMSKSRLVTLAVVLTAAVVTAVFVLRPSPSDYPTSTSGEQAIADEVAIKPDGCEQRQMRFEQATLSEIVDAVNRCSDVAIEIEDESLLHISVSGQFTLEEAAGFVTMLEEVGLATSYVREDGTIVLRHKNR